MNFISALTLLGAMSRRALQDVRIREAFSITINQQDIIDYVTMGNQSPAAGIVPPFVGYNSPGDIKFDPDKAKKLLEEAGYPGGEGFPKLISNH